MTVRTGVLRRPRGGGGRFDRGLLAPMLLGAVLNPVNSSIIAVSLIPIGQAFRAPPSSTAWLVSALYLATAIGQPVVGRLIDLFGPRRLYLAATALVGATGRRGAVRGKLLVAAIGQITACVLLLGLHAGSPIWFLVGITVVFGVPQGLTSLALQNSVYHQADPERVASSAGLLRTSGYLGAILASSATAAFFPERADTPGMHHLTWFMLTVAVLFLAVTAADRSLRRVGTSAGKN